MYIIDSTGQLARAQFIVLFIRWLIHGHAEYEVTQRLVAGIIKHASPATSYWDSQESLVNEDDVFDKDYQKK